MKASWAVPVIASILILVSTLFINQAFAVPDDEWQLREQEITTLQTVGCTFVTDSTRILIQMFPDKTKVGFCHMFKVFDKADIQNKILNVTWNQDLDFFTFSRISVFDGAYDRNNATQFPLDPIAFTFSGFTRALPEGLQGGGQLHTVFRTDRFNPTTDPPDSINMTLAGSTLPQVTIAITFRDGSTSTRFAGGIDEIKIIDFAKWDWDSSSSVTMAVTGTQNDIGVTNANFTNLIPAVNVSIDIKPNSDPNCFNNDGNGVIPVAILGSNSFDVTLVDSSTIQLEGMAVKVVGKANKLLSSIEDVNGDGFNDLVVKIEDTDGVFIQGTGTATLTGNLLDGTPIEGTDTICITQ